MRQFLNKSPGMHCGCKSTSSAGDGGLGFRTFGHLRLYTLCQFTKKPPTLDASISESLGRDCGSLADGTWDDVGLSGLRGYLKTLRSAGFRDRDANGASM